MVRTSRLQNQKVKEMPGYGSEHKQTSTRRKEGKEEGRREGEVGDGGGGHGGVVGQVARVMVAMPVLR